MLVLEAMRMINEPTADLLPSSADEPRMPLPLLTAGWAGVLFGALAALRAISFATSGEALLIVAAIVGIGAGAALLSGEPWGYLACLAVGAGSSVASIVLLATSDKGTALGVSLGVGLAVVVLLLAPPQSRTWFTRRVRLNRSHRQPGRLSSTVG
jgi:hypothetical protein